MSNNPFQDTENELTTILVVSNMTKAKIFYVDQLGAELYREYGGNSIVLKFLNQWVLLVTAGGPTTDKPDISFQPPEHVSKVSHAFTIRVRDCKYTYELLKERGVEFITPPHDWGQEIRCFFKDPDGHLFEISQISG